MLAHQWMAEPSTTTIHGTPKRSASIPKLEEKKVLSSGMVTFPSSPSVPTQRFAY